MTRPTMSGQSLRFTQGMVSYVGCVCLSVPSPCERRNRLRVVHLPQRRCGWTDPTPCHLRLSYLSFGSAYLNVSGVVRVSQVPDASLHAYRALRGPRQTLWNLAPPESISKLMTNPHATKPPPD